MELVKGCPENYAILHEKLLKQHQPGPNSPYPWDYWPHEDGRSECGYVGELFSWGREYQGINSNNQHVKITKNKKKCF